MISVIIDKEEREKTPHVDKKMFYKKKQNNPREL